MCYRTLHYLCAVLREIRKVIKMLLKVSPKPPKHTKSDALNTCAANTVYWPSNLLNVLLRVFVYYSCGQLRKPEVRRQVRPATCIDKV